MKFINREKELALLARAKESSLSGSKMTILVGRRRIGKTRLIAESHKTVRYLYFFVARKEEKLLCDEFVQLLRESLGIAVYGELPRFRDVFALLMDYAEREPLTLVIDEFQEFFRLNPSVYSDMQSIWDRKKEHTKMHLILCGSIFSMMKKIFEDSREPLFGRADERLHVKPFSVDTLTLVMEEYHPLYTPEDLLNLYIFTGGVPKYVELLVDRGALSTDAMLGEILQENSLFLEEGKNVLIEEFGKEYATYFSVLSLLASSKTSRSELESTLQKDVGGYLSRLETEYQIIKRVTPLFSKPGSRNIRYAIDDNFLHFWFRFIYKNRATVEIGNFGYLRSLINRDFPTFSGYFLEKFMIEKLALSGEWSEIGAYWETGFTNQIDIVAVNRLDKKLLIAEVKRNPKQYSESILRQKAYNLIRDFSGFDIVYKGFSLLDVVVGMNSDDICSDDM